jgi:hypothetical protein
MAHSPQFSTDIQLVKLPHFWKVAVTIAIWHRCSKIAMILNSMLTASLRMTLFTKKCQPLLSVCDPNFFFFRLYNFGHYVKTYNISTICLAVSGPEPEVCAITNAGSIGGWEDVSCDSVNTYICEIPASKIVLSYKQLYSIVKAQF